MLFREMMLIVIPGREGGTRNPATLLSEVAGIPACAGDDGRDLQCRTAT